MKAFERVSKNDLVLEFLKFMNEKTRVCISKLEVKRYEDENITKNYKRKTIFVNLNDCEYFVNLSYSSIGNKTTLNIYKPVYRERKDVLYECVVSHELVK